MTHSKDIPGLVENLDYLIDDVVADAYVWGAEGRSTEVSPQSAKTLHDAIVEALAALRPAADPKAEGRVELWQCLDFDQQLACLLARWWLRML